MTYCGSGYESFDMDVNLIFESKDSLSWHIQYLLERRDLTASWICSDRFCATEV